MQRLLVVGWDAADWKVINPLLAKGEMPHLARLMAEGVWGNLATIYPPLSPMVWTSIATGKRPYKHGIHGFTEPAQDGMSVRPVSSLGRKTKAFWNILNQNGKRSIVVGWWPSHPAEPIRGAMVSNWFSLAEGSDLQGPMLPGTVSPQVWAERLADLRVSPTELNGPMLRAFVPDAHKVDQTTDHGLSDLAHIIAETMSTHAAATELIEHEPWDMAAVYFVGIDHFSHRFMRYHAGKPVPPSASGAELYAGVVSNAYRYHDVMLGRLLQVAGEDCAVMVLSDHGFHSDRLLPDYIPAEAAGPAVEHRELGIFCLRGGPRGPRVLRGQRIYGGSVLDIAPTILHLFGVPAARDMDGKVLINAFEDHTICEPVASWDEIEGEDGRHPTSQQYDPASSAEALKQLVDLGYIAPPGDDARKAVDSCLVENRYHLAEAYIGGGLLQHGAAMLRELIAEDQEQGRFHISLFDCALGCGDLVEAQQILNAFDKACSEFAPRSAAELKKRQEAFPQGKQPEPRSREQFEWRELAEKSRGFAFERLTMRARLALAGATTPKRKAAAREVLEKLAAASGRRSEPALFLAHGFATVGEPERALVYTRKALRADRDCWRAMALEAQIHFNARQYEKAVESALDSLSLVYFQPPLHSLLGIALLRLGEEEKAERELQVALSQQPGLAAAHEALAELLRRCGRIGEAGLHLAKAQVGGKTAVEKRKARAAAAPIAEPKSKPALAPFERFEGPPADRGRVVTIVAGLPRSGTSMMMQMLAAGGVEAYTDGSRAADEDNPRGYLEHADATNLHRDASWLARARGKAVKVVASLVPHLPAGEEYRVIFMLRNPREVVASQTAMLSRIGKRGGALKEDALIQAYGGQLVRVQAWLGSRANVQCIGVDYAAVLADPHATAARLALFLGEPFNAAAAAAAVEPALRRQRA